MQHHNNDQYSFPYKSRLTLNFWFLSFNLPPPSYLVELLARLKSLFIFLFFKHDNEVALLVCILVKNVKDAIFRRMDFYCSIFYIMCIHIFFKHVCKNIEWYDLIYSGNILWISCLTSLKAFTKSIELNNLYLELMVFF